MFRELLGSGHARKHDRRPLGREAARPRIELLEGRVLLSAQDLLVYNSANSDILRYDGETGDFVGEFVASQAGGLNFAWSMAFGPDGNLYVASFNSNNILRFDGTTGDFIDAFVPAGSGGLNGPTQLTFGPDGNLYVGERTGAVGTTGVLSYDGTTGAFLGVFATIPASFGFTDVPALTFSPDGSILYCTASNGLVNTGRVFQFDGATGAYINDLPIGAPDPNPTHMMFGPDGDLYVSEITTDFFASDNGDLEHYDGTTGAFVNAFADPTLRNPWGLAFGPDGNLYATGVTSNNIARFATPGNFIDEFVPAGSGGLTTPFAITFFPSPGPAPHTSRNHSAMASLASASLTAETHLTAAIPDRSTTFHGTASMEMAHSEANASSATSVASPLSAGLALTPSSRSDVFGSLDMQASSSLASNAAIDTLFGQEVAYPWATWTA